MSGTNFDADQIVVTDGLTLYLPSGLSVQDDDTFTVRGKVYEIDGEAFDWRDGLGSWSPGHGCKPTEANRPWLGP